MYRRMVSFFIVCVCVLVLAPRILYANEFYMAQRWDTVIENMGVLYFYKPTCSYCQQQKTILDDFQNTTGFENIIGIDITERPDLAKQYGISTVPDLWLVGQVGKNLRQRRISIGLMVKHELMQMLAETFTLWFPPEPAPADTENIPRLTIANTNH